MINPSMRFALLLTSLLLSGTTLLAQEPELYWSRTYGGEQTERGLGGCPAGDGFVFVGYIESFGFEKSNEYIVRVDGSGDTLWTLLYGGPYRDEARSVVQTRDGGFILGVQAGIGHDDGDPGVPMAIKIDGNGGHSWYFFPEETDKYYVLKDVRESPDGHFVIVGSEISLDLKTTSGWIAILNSQGELMWSETYKTKYGAGFTSIDFTGENGFAVAGYINVSSTDTDAWLLQCNEGGDTIWTKKFGGHGDDRFSALRVSEDATYVCVGTSNSFGGGDNDVLSVRYRYGESNFRLNVFGGQKSQVGNSVILTEDGGCVIAGTTQRPDGEDFDAWLIGVNNENYLVWANRYGGTGAEEGMAVRHAPDGGYWLIGSSESFSNGSSDAWLLRLTTGPISSVSDRNTTTSDIVLGAPSPNPFNHTTSLQWQMEKSGHVTISVHDLLGRAVRILEDEWLEAGTYATEWNGMDALGQSALNGTYLYTIELNGKPLASGTILLQR